MTIVSPVKGSIDKSIKDTTFPVSESTTGRVSGSVLLPVEIEVVGIVNYSFSDVVYSDSGPIGSPRTAFSIFCFVSSSFGASIGATSVVGASNGASIGGI